MIKGLFAAGILASPLQLQRRGLSFHVDEQFSRLKERPSRAPSGRMLRRPRPVDPGVLSVTR
jgi:hypothetical protein